MFIATPNSPMTASIVATVALDEQIPEHTRADMCLSCNHLFFQVTSVLMSSVFPQDSEETAEIAHVNRCEWMTHWGAFSVGDIAGLGPSR